MKYIFLLSGDYAELGQEEILSLFNAKNNYKKIGRLLIVDFKKNNEKEFEKIIKRLALTKRIYRFLFECKVNEIIKIMKEYDWNSVYQDNFRIRIHDFEGNDAKSINNKTLKNKEINDKNIKKVSEKELAGHIWHSVEKPKVNLENTKTKIQLFFINNVVYCGLLIYENKEDFESRKSHLRPFPNPSSLHPKIARALVNISGISGNKTLLDPFCGTGGFLIEAGLMEINFAGCDISKNMADGCNENLKYFKTKKYEIFNANALKISKKFDYVVTDLPYGLNSNIYLEYDKKSINDKSNKINLKTNEKFSISKIENFYLLFLNNLRKIMTCKAVIIFPSYADYRRLLKKSGFAIEKEFSIYVHRNLTRKIVRIRLFTKIYC